MSLEALCCSTPKQQTCRLYCYGTARVPNCTFLPFLPQLLHHRCCVHTHLDTKVGLEHKGLCSACNNFGLERRLDGAFVALAIRSVRRHDAVQRGTAGSKALGGE